MDEARLEMIDRNKDRALQQKRISTIIQVSGLLGVDELTYIKTVSYTHLTLPTILLV